jgi:hypothetical protein
MFSEKVVHQFSAGMDDVQNRPAPSSPRQFFQRLYGHLEDNVRLRDPKVKGDIEIEHLNTDSSCSDQSSRLEPDDEFKVVDNNRCAQITSNYMDTSVGNFPTTINTALSPAPSSTSSNTPLSIMPQHFGGGDYHQAVFPPGLTAFREYCILNNYFYFRHSSSIIDKTKSSGSF